MIGPSINSRTCRFVPMVFGLASTQLTQDNFDNWKASQMIFDSQYLIPRRFIAKPLVDAAFGFSIKVAASYFIEG